MTVRDSGRDWNEIETFATSGESFHPASRSQQPKEPAAMGRDRPGQLDHPQRKSTNNDWFVLIGQAPLKQLDVQYATEGVARLHATYFPVALASFGGGPNI